MKPLQQHKHYKTIATVFGPGFMGHPYARDRSVTTSIDEEDEDWHGNLEEFHNWFGGRECLLTPAVYFIAPTDCLQRWKETLGKKAGLNKEECTADLPWKAVLPGGAVGRINSCKEKYYKLKCHKRDQDLESTEKKAAPLEANVQAAREDCPAVTPEKKTTQESTTEGVLPMGGAGDDAGHGEVRANNCYKNRAK